MNKENKKSFKDELKEFWIENKDKIKIGLKCLGAGLLIGCAYGAVQMGKADSEIYAKLVDKIPYEPDCDDIAEYVHDHMDELKGYYEAEKEYLDSGDVSY